MISLFTSLLKIINENMQGNGQTLLISYYRLFFNKENECITETKGLSGEQTYFYDYLTN